MLRLITTLLSLTIALPALAINSVSSNTYYDTVYMTPLAKIKHQVSLGDKQATFALASLYYDPGKSRVVRQSYIKAVQLYRKAAFKGHIPSQYNLGLMYVDGEGVKVDVEQGYAWISIAYDTGLLQAKEIIDQLEQAMNESQLAQAKEIKNKLLRKVRK